MGLHIQNLGSLPVEADRDYFIYVLDYGWKEPLTETLVANFTNMARKASDSNSIVLAGIDPIHFANEVFSWHGINGEDGEKVLPALMVTSLHPSYFRDHNGLHPEAVSPEINDQLLLIPLKKVCETTEDVVELIKSIFADIREEKRIVSFEIAKEMEKEEPGKSADALILEPNFYGIGLRIPELIKRIRKR